MTPESADINAVKDASSDSLDPEHAANRNPWAPLTRTRSDALAPTHSLRVRRLGTTHSGRHTRDDTLGTTHSGLAPGRTRSDALRAGQVMIRHCNYTLLYYALRFHKSLG